MLCHYQLCLTGAVASKRLILHSLPICTQTTCAHILCLADNTRTPTNCSHTYVSCIDEQKTGFWRRRERTIMWQPTCAPLSLRRTCRLMWSNDGDVSIHRYMMCVLVEFVQHNFITISCVLLSLPCLIQVVTLQGSSNTAEQSHFVKFKFVNFKRAKGDGFKPKSVLNLQSCSLQ